MANEPMTPEQMQETFEQDAGSGFPDVTNRDRSLLILEQMDCEEQLTAIAGLLRRNKAADEQLESERKEIIEFIKRSSGSAQEHAIDESGENFYAMVYQGAVHSMAAVGMIAPMYETLFHQAFQGIRARYFGPSEILPGHHRATMSPDDYWDCHKYYDKNKSEVKENVASGIVQLAKAMGLKKHLPADLPKTLAALFDYRNFMLHNGFEWPLERRPEFALHIKSGGWDDWFFCSERDHRPWIFYMKDGFITHCLDMVPLLLDGFGAYCEERTPVDMIPVEEASTK